MKASIIYRENMLDVKIICFCGQPVVLFAAGKNIEKKCPQCGRHLKVLHLEFS